MEIHGSCWEELGGCHEAEMSAKPTPQSLSLAQLLVAQALALTTEHHRLSELHGARRSPGLTLCSSAAWLMGSCADPAVH